MEHIHVCPCQGYMLHHGSKMEIRVACHPMLLVHINIIPPLNVSYMLPYNNGRDQG